jgi:hypothetical protein
LGFASFYQWFIRNFRRIARPLHGLMGSVEWRWGKEQQEAFDELKTTFEEQVMLAILDDEGKFQVECNASDYAFGAVLSQKGKDGKWCPVDIMTKGMDLAQHNYEIYDKELLAVMMALNKWHTTFWECKKCFRSGPITRTSPFSESCSNSLDDRQIG